MFMTQPLKFLSSQSLSAMCQYFRLGRRRHARGFRLEALLLRDRQRLLRHARDPALRTSSYCARLSGSERFSPLP